MSQNKTGRPALNIKDIDTIFRKLEPHLKAGLSLHKAILIEKIPKSTVYDLKHSSDEFAENLELAKNHQSILVSNIINNELENIQSTQKSSLKNLNRDQLKFVQWVAINSKTTKEEFNRDDIEDKETKKDQIIFNDKRVTKTLMKVHRAFITNAQDIVKEQENMT